MSTESTTSRRLVFTWRLAYATSGKAALVNCDGGPYLHKANAIAAAKSASQNLREQRNVVDIGRYEIQSHEAAICQPVMEEVFPERF